MRKISGEIKKDLVKVRDREGKIENEKEQEREDDQARGKIEIEKVLEPERMREQVKEDDVAPKRQRKRECVLER